MKVIKRWTAFLLFCALVLACAGCAGSEPQASSSGSGSGGGGAAAGGKGRYVESDITPPDAEGEVLHSFLAEDGTLECYSWDLTKKFASADGGDSWQETAGPNADGALRGEVQACTRLAGGSLLVAEAGPDGNATGLVRLGPDGAAQPFPVAPLDEAIAKGPTTHVSLLRAVSEDRLLLDFFSGDFGRAVIGGEEEEEDESASAPGGDNSFVVGGEGGEPAAGGEGEDEYASAPEGEDESEGSGFVVADGSQINFTGLIDLAGGGVVAEYPEWYGLTGAADADTLYLLGYRGEVTAKALADGKAQTKGEGQVAIGEMEFDVAMAAGPEGLHVLNSKNIQKMDAGGTSSVLVDGSTYSFSAVGSTRRALHLLPGGDMVAQVDDDTGSRLYRYRWDESAELNPDDVLKVWSLEENHLLRAAITALRRASPSAAVAYEVALEQGGGVTAEDAIKNLNTQLLNGDGPDVLILDGVPAESYAARGMLQDLSSVVSKDGMFPNIAAPFTTSAGTFYLPTGVKIPVLLGTRENLDKAATLAQLAQFVQDGKPLPEVGPSDDVFAALPEEQKPVLAPQDLREVYDLLWNTSAGQVITPEGLDAAALAEMLKTLLAISEKYGMGNGGGAPGGVMSMGSSGGMVAQVSGSVLAYGTGRAVLGAYSANDIQMLENMMAPPESELAAFPGLGGGSFVPAGVVGISAGSPRAELAAQFVNLMLSEEVQGIKTGNSLPVTEAGMKKQIVSLNELMQNPGNGAVGFSFDYQPLMNLAQTPQMADQTVNGMVWEAAQSLCKGEIDVEGAVVQLEQELRNYLAERQ